MVFAKAISIIERTLFYDNFMLRNTFFIPFSKTPTKHDKNTFSVDKMDKFLIFE